MVLTNTIQTSIGDEKTNLFINPTFHVSELLSTGMVQVDLRFYNSEAAKNAGVDAVYAVVDNNKITNCTIQCSPDDVIKESGQSKLSDVVAYFYSKVKSKLEETYNWTITL